MLIKSIDCIQHQCMNDEMTVYVAKWKQQTTKTSISAMYVQMKYGDKLLFVGKSGLGIQ